MTTTLRPLIPADLPHLSRMEGVLFGAAAWSDESLAEEIVGLGRWYIGVEVDGRLVGYAGLWFDGFDAQVMTIGTDEPFQGRGIGRLMIDALVDRARTLGAAVVLLEVRVDNEPAIRLYRSVGFEQLGLRRGYYQPGNVDAWTMRLDLRVPSVPDQEHA